MTVCYKLLHQFACPIRRAVIDINNAKVVIVLGNDRRKVTLIRLAIVIAWYYYGDLFHELFPLQFEERGHVAAWHARSCALQAMYPTEGLRLRIAMWLAIPHRQIQANSA